MKTKILGTVLVLLLVSTCSIGYKDDSWKNNCRSSGVTFHVYNNTSFVVGMYYGNRRTVTRLSGYEETEIHVVRGTLERFPIYLTVLGGGLTIGRSMIRVNTTPLICNEATLVIGPRLEQSMFYGSEPVEGDHGEEENEPDSASTKLP